MRHYLSLMTLQRHVEIKSRVPSDGGCFRFRLTRDYLQVSLEDVAVTLTP